MVIITSMSFPPESATEVGKRFLETSPVPDFLTLKGPYIKGMKDGIQAFELYELDTLKISEGLEYASNRCVTYFGIPNFKYDINVFFEAAEALKMIGLG
jgi:hypothetical protein